MGLPIIVLVLFAVVLVVVIAWAATRRPLSCPISDQECGKHCAWYDRRSEPHCRFVGANCEEGEAARSAGEEPRGQAGRAIVGSYPVKCEQGHDAIALVWADGRVEVACPACGRYELSGRAGRPEEARATPSLEDTRPLPPLGMGRGFPGSRETVMKHREPRLGVWVALAILVGGLSLWGLVNTPAIRDYCESHLFARAGLTKSAEEFKSPSKPEQVRLATENNTQTGGAQEPQKTGPGSQQNDTLKFQAREFPKPTPEEPVIVGSQDFHLHMVSALGDLQVHDPSGYELVCKYLYEIREDTAKAGSTGACVHPTTGIVYFMTPPYPYYYWVNHRIPDRNSYWWAWSIPGWYPSVLVHEATHVYLYHEMGMPWSGEEVERMCVDRQKMTLYALNLSPNLKDMLVNGLDRALDIQYGKR